MLENEFRRLEEYVQNHIKKETKVFLPFLFFAFSSFLLFLFVGGYGESGVVVVVVVDDDDDGDMTMKRSVIKRWRIRTRTDPITDTRILVNKLS